jgi:hypothetical protein
MTSLQGTSEIESDLFAQLRYVLGCGEQHDAVNGMRSRAVDMVFWLEFDQALVVEYDGAYWHRGRERGDRWKAESVSLNGWLVIRVREEPLRPLRPEDVWVPKAADAAMCARLVILHAAHLLGGYQRSRMEHFLMAAAVPLTQEQVPCRACWHDSSGVRASTQFDHRCRSSHYVNSRTRASSGLTCTTTVSGTMIHLNVSKVVVKGTGMQMRSRSV